MRFLTITLDADDTPKSIKTLGELTEKFKNIAYFAIYAETGNDNDATNGPARIGGAQNVNAPDNQDVDRVAADAGAEDDAVANGFPLLPGMLYTDLFQPIGAGCGVYSFETIYITGKTGDIFQIGYVLV